MEFVMPSKKFLFWLACSLYFCPPPLSANAQAASGAVTLFSNVRIFDADRGRFLPRQMC